MSSPERPVLEAGTLNDRSHGQGSRFRRGDDRIEGVNFIHSEVGDAEDRSGIFFGLQRLGLGALDEVSGLQADLTQALVVAIADDHGGQTLFEPNRKPDINSMVDPELLPQKGGSKVREVSKRQGCGLHDEVPDGDLYARSRLGKLPA